MAETAVLSVRAFAPSVVAGHAATFLIDRNGDMNSACAVEWACDDLNGILSFDPSDVTCMVAVPTVDMAGQSESRRVTLTLRKPLGAELGTATATVTIEESNGGPVTPIIEAVDPGTVKYQTGYAIAPANKVRAVGWTLAGAAGNYASDKLQDALNDAKGGEYVVLDDGTYSGDFNLTQAGTAANPIHIRARNHLKAVFSGRLLIGTSLTNAAYTWITGLKFTYLNPSDAGLNENHPIVIRSSNVYVTNNWFPSIRSGVRYVYAAGMTGCKLNFNTFETGWPGNWAHASLVVVHSIPQSNPGPSNFEWAYNYLLDNVDYTGSGGNERHCFSVQPSKPDRASAFGDRSFVMHHNFTRGNFTRHMYSKRHCTIEYNVTDGYGAGQFGFRHGHQDRAKGTGGIIQGNYVSGPVLLVNGGGAIIRGNSQPKGPLRLFAGTVPGPGDTVGIYQSSKNAIVCDHRGTIVVGYRNQNDPISEDWGGKVSGIDIYRGNQSSVDASAYDGGTEAAPTAKGYQVLDGFGTQPVITPITIANLAGVAGCDGHTATTARP